MLSVMTTTSLDITGPYDLGEIATMGFGHRDERSFDGVMRMAFCLDGDYERQIGVAARQVGDRVELELQTIGPPLSDDEVTTARAQVARVLSLDGDGTAFARVCEADPVLARIHAAAPGFRPANFYSPYEAAAWSIISARRARPQGIALRTRLSAQCGATFEVAGERTYALPTPRRFLEIEALPGLPADRIPRLRAIAEAAQQGRLAAAKLRGMEPDAARADLQQLPGIGPFYSALIVIRALGHTDVLAVEEGHFRAAAQELYGVDHELSTAELTELAERWRPFRTWASVLIRAKGALQLSDGGDRAKDVKAELLTSRGRAAP